MVWQLRLGNRKHSTFHFVLFSHSLKRKPVSMQWGHLRSTLELSRGELRPQASTTLSALREGYLESGSSPQLSLYPWLTPDKVAWGTQSQKHPIKPLLNFKPIDILRHEKWYIVLSHSVQSLSQVWLFATPWTTAHQASLSITNSRSLLKLKYIKSVGPSNCLILCRLLLLLPSIFPASGSF